ncbi:MAG TPA: hypothetical protein VNE16_00390 [Vicinamibacterales bacterium]|nr:hypothetical protein [Vicinamibacterales bacterium]
MPAHAAAAMSPDGIVERAADRTAGSPETGIVVPCSGALDVACLAIVLTLLGVVLILAF